MSLFGKIDDLSAQKKYRTGWTYAVIAIFLLFIILPSLYVIISVFSYWDGIGAVISDGGLMSTVWKAVGISFSIALIVTVIDIIIGLPMAWILVRKKFKGKNILDTLIDLPLAFPTAVLGISVVMFWGCPDGVSVPGLGLVFSPYLMLILLHIIFTYPYMVRSLSAILEQIDENYETAAMTLGASKITAIRTITLPLFRSGLVTGFILCFARSLSETGGTQIALDMMGAAGWYTGPTLICDEKTAMEVKILVSVIMIVIAFILLFAVKAFMTKANIKWSRVFPKWERKISRGNAAKASNVITIALLFILVLIPAFYLFSYLSAGQTSMDWGQVFAATGVSFLIAGVAVVFDIIFGIPMALYIVRHSDSKLGKAMDSLINVPLIVPTAALGVSLAMFWGGFGLTGMGLLLVIFGHIAFTYPLMVRNIIGALEEVDISYEEVAMTLGAKPFQAFRKILLPIIKSSIIAGGILAFTRSLGETGATAAIDSSVISIPVLIMKWVGDKDYASAAMAAIFLVVICFVLLMAVRLLTKSKGDNDA